MSTVVAELIAKLKLNTEGLEKGAQRSASVLDALSKRAAAKITAIAPPLKHVQDGLDALGVNGAAALSGGVATAAVVAGAAMVKFGGDSIRAASALGEQINGTRVTFGRAAEDVLKWSKTTGSALGISREEALRTANMFGAFFDVIKAGPQVSADLSKGLIQLAADLASFKDVNPADALQSLRAGLAGETEPLRRFGVFLNESAVQAKAASLGLTEYGGRLTDGQKIIARYALILEQTKKAQTDFARTSNSAANQNRVLAANFQDLKAEVGAVLVPLLNLGQQLLTFVFHALEPAGQALVKIGRVVGAVTGFIGKHLFGASAASKQAEQAYKDQAKALEEAAAKANEAARAQMGLGAATAETQKTISEQRSKLLDVAGGALSVESAHLRLERAQQALNEAQRAGAERTRNIASAQKDLQSSARGVADAQERLREAQDALNAALRGPDVNDVTRANLNLREAQLSLADAQDKVNELAKQGSPNAREQARAQLELENAQLRLAEAQQAQGDIGKNAADKVAQAQRALRDAQQAVTDANDRLTESQNRLAEAQKPASTMALREAQLALREAQLGVQQATIKQNELLSLLSQTLGEGGDNARILRKELQDLADLGIQLPTIFDPLAAAEAAYSSFRAGERALQGRPMAHGGIVRRPTTALIGEAGPEAVIPLRNAGGIGGNTVINLTVNGAMDPNAVANQIHNVLLEKQRRTGSLGLR